jgi:hypothetical protein
MTSFQQALRFLWEYLREACGENDYARYRARSLRQGNEPMPPQAYYLRQLQQKYSRPNRCC